MNTIVQLLQKQKVIVGALHLSPSPGFEGFDTIDNALERAQKDTQAFLNGGVDAIIIENNYDIPHIITVGPETIAYMASITAQLRITKVPIGISVLWNDYEAAFSVAKATYAEFIRIPAFVDDVKTSYGVANAVAKEAYAFRKKIDAEHIAIFADIHVKHAEMVDKKKSLEQSLQEAEDSGADAVVITGQWTGDAPLIQNLKLAKESIALPVIVGSGADADNISELLQYADGAIVSTALKEGAVVDKKNNPNLKKFEQRISSNKVREFMRNVT